MVEKIRMRTVTLHRGDMPALDKQVDVAKKRRLTAIDDNFVEHLQETT